jgi:hypothetical protein
LAQDRFVAPFEQMTALFVAPMSDPKVLAQILLTGFDFAGNGGEALGKQGPRDSTITESMS